MAREFFLIALISFWILLFRPVYAQQESRPNLIVFLVDDMGWQDTSVPFADSTTVLNKIFRTPAMEKLATMGMKFTNAYGNPVCTPTRVSILTGAASARHRVTNWTNVNRDQPTDYPDEKLLPPKWNYNGLQPNSEIPNSFHSSLLPELLRANGYKTLHVGKAHFAPYGTPGSDPKNLGFDVNIAGTAAGHPGSFLGNKNFRGGPNDSLWAVPDLDQFHGSETFLTEALTIRAIEELEKINSNEPFFLHLSHFAVHLPFDQDNRFYEAYRSKGLSETEARYASLVSGMDKSLGDLLGYLERTGRLENTYLFFLSDNGGLTLTPQRGGLPHTQNAPLRLGKGSVYEGGIRIPFLVAGPGIGRGIASDFPIAVQDLFPTLLKLSRTDLPASDGIDLSVFWNEKKGPPTSRELLWHYPHHWTKNSEGGLSWSTAYRKGNHKLIWFHRTGKLELYDLKKDPGETKDLYSTNSTDAKRMKKLMEKSLKSHAAQLPIERSTGRELSFPD